MSVNDVSRWHNGVLVAAAPTGSNTSPILAADSWLVTEGRTRGLALHRDRFVGAVDASGVNIPDVEDFWDAAVASLPRTGEWFPRVELRAASPDVGADGANGAGGADDADRAGLFLLTRSAPLQERQVVVATLEGDDTRIAPRTKGPDLDRMLRARTSVAAKGAGEAIIISDEGFVVEGAYSGLLWWRGSILCAPLDEFDRVDSVTVRSVLALATALGVETYTEAVTPAELEGTELWALSALHGVRIVTEWVDGPSLAELPGRLGQWRARLAALRQPL
jgi:branched-subunit amino acid aminotransferase/4-amino-4-deoxychorismate lyase